QAAPDSGCRDDTAPQSGVLPVRPGSRRDRRGLAPGQRGRLVAPRPDRGGARDRPDARALRRARVGLGRGALDARRGDRRGGARSRARGRALRALRLERRSRLPGPPALRHAVRVRRPCREGARQMSPPRSDGLVIFGASGDLAYKKIFPALDARTRRGHLDVPVVGVARSDWTLEQFRARARESIERHGRFDEATFARLRERLRYVRGDYGDPATLEALRRALGGAKRPLHYLAIPPSLFETVVGGLGRSSGARDARVVVEKPFGRDLASAQALNKTLHEVFDESRIFRIDHYLGKESVRDEQVRVFRTIRPLSADDLVRGQFRGYRKEKGVAADSTVETFAAARLHIDSWRWDGVPFFLRAGKCLATTRTEVLVTLRRPPLSRLSPRETNYVLFQLSPQVKIAIGARVKRPGEQMITEPTELQVVHHAGGEEMDAYERLLGDAMA